jgi:hypothetical protein
LTGQTRPEFEAMNVTDAELVQRAREGDRDAFDLLMTALIDRLYRIARLILP